MSDSLLFPIPQQPVVIDGRNHMLGRLASIVAKELLNGQRVVCIALFLFYLYRVECENGWASLWFRMNSSSNMVSDIPSPISLLFLLDRRPYRGDQHLWISLQKQA